VTDCPHEKNDPSFTIRIWPQRRFVETVMRGFWTPEDRRRFDAELRALLPVLPAAGCPIRERVTLYDLTDFQVQAQEIIGGLMEMAADPAIESKRVAIVVLSGLLKLQARRVHEKYAFFETREAAMAWLTQAPVSSG